MGAVDIATLVIALVGAATGVAALVTQVWELVLSGPRVKVAVANAFLTANGAWVLSIDASNVGRLPVTILDMGVTFRARGEWKKAPLGGMPQGSWHGPDGGYRLADGEAAGWFVEPAVLLPGLAQFGVREVHGYVRLATGKTVRSHKRIDVPNLASLD